MWLLGAGEDIWVKTCQVTQSSRGSTDSSAILSPCCLFSVSLFACNTLIIAAAWMMLAEFGWQPVGHFSPLQANEVLNDLFRKNIQVQVRKTAAFL